MTGSRHDALKRLMDVVVSGLLLVLTLPVQAVVALLVRRNLGSPVLFRQLRPGLHEHVFELIKFRTMLAEDPEHGLVSDTDRLTPCGALLRSTSLDELPTLWNVFKGDMSLVGPRPLLVQYLDRYSARQARRHEVRPGITGLAQVLGRNAIPWDEKLELDVRYIESRTIRLDGWILWRTAFQVVRRQGISAEGSVTIPEFGLRHDD